MALKIIITIRCKAKWVAFTLLAFNATAQSLNFDFVQSKPNLYLIAGFEESVAKANSSVKLVIYGQLDEGWHLYSIKKHPDLNIIPTSVVYQNTWYQKQGELKESETTNIFDEALEIEVQAHRKQFQLQQTLLIHKDAPVGSLDLTGYVQYQVCNQKVCLKPQETKFIASIMVIE